MVEVMKKQDFVKFFLKNNLLISPEILKNINSENIYDYFLENLNSSIFIEKKISSSIKNIEEISKPPKYPKVNILFSYQENQNKKKFDDFVKYFKVRYNALRKILSQRQETQNSTSITRKSGKKLPTGETLSTWQVFSPGTNVHWRDTSIALGSRATQGCRVIRNPSDQHTTPPLP